MGLARLHQVVKDSGRFPNRGQRVKALDIDTDLVKRVVPQSTTGNSSLIMVHGEGFDLCETPDQAAVWLQDPKVIDSVNILPSGVSSLAVTASVNRTAAQNATPAAYITKITTAAGGSKIALPVPTAFAVVTVINEGANATAVVPDDDATPLDGVASGSTEEALAIGARKVFYVKADAALGWFLLS